MEYDIYGFPKNNNIDEPMKIDLRKWIKIFFWLSLVIVVIFKIFGMGISGYLSYNQYILETGFLKYIKIILAIIFSELYLLGKVFIVFKNYIYI
jgi:hypothetical protein